MQQLTKLPYALAYPPPGPTRLDAPAVPAAADKCQLGAGAAALPGSTAMPAARAAQGRNQAVKRRHGWPCRTPAGWPGCPTPAAAPPTGCCPTGPGPAAPTGRPRTPAASLQGPGRGGKAAHGLPLTGGHQLTGRALGGRRGAACTRGTCGCCLAPARQRCCLVPAGRLTLQLVPAQRQELQALQLRHVVRQHAGDARVVQVEVLQARASGGRAVGRGARAPALSKPCAAGVHASCRLGRAMGAGRHGRSCFCMLVAAHARDS